MIKELKDENFQYKPTRIIYIPKINEKFILTP